MQNARKIAKSKKALARLLACDSAELRETYNSPSQKKAIIVINAINIILLLDLLSLIQANPTIGFGGCQAIFALFNTALAGSLQNAICPFPGLVPASTPWP